MNQTVSVLYCTDLYQNKKTIKKTCFYDLVAQLKSETVSTQQGSSCPSREHSVSLNNQPSMDKGFYVYSSFCKIFSLFNKALGVEPLTQINKFIYPAFLYHLPC